MDGVSDIFQEVVNYFYNHFREPLLDQPMLDGIFYPPISEEDCVSLMVPFHLSDIDRVVSLCDGNKSPGPDGFYFSFF